MKDIKAIIGANFGDEGKGMLTHYFAKNAAGKCLNVLYNGGAQRGHTVDGFVFHCYGAATFDGADTYYAPTFMLNPIAVCEERYALSKRNAGKRQIFINSNALVTLPFDIQINRDVEDSRGKNRHGSCGMGIYETQIRSRQIPVYARDLLDVYALYEKLKHIKELYVPHRCKELGIDVPSVFIEGFLVSSCELLEFAQMVSDEEYLFNNYDSILFEGSQGLLLDENRSEFFPHVTASSTGSTNIAHYINAHHGCKAEICYVSRSYLTRHGNGDFPTECKREDVNLGIVDSTNIPNPYQGALRFGYLDIAKQFEVIKQDLTCYNRPIDFSVAYTQLEYTGGKLIQGRNAYIDIPHNINTYRFFKEYI